MEWAPGVRKHLAAGDFAADLRQILAFYSFMKSLSLFRDLIIKRHFITGQSNLQIMTA